ncbi:hypothetical protein DIPPA_32549 [Diplonema papillatum]|nr:hypothetical protein DIPPA_32549 [Diplonema papillatum]
MGCGGSTAKDTRQPKRQKYEEQNKEKSAERKKEEVKDEASSAQGRESRSNHAVEGTDKEAASSKTRSEKSSEHHSKGEKATPRNPNNVTGAEAVGHTYSNGALNSTTNTNTTANNNSVAANNASTTHANGGASAPGNGNDGAKPALSSPKPASIQPAGDKAQPTDKEDATDHATAGRSLSAGGISNKLSTTASVNTSHAVASTLSSGDDEDPEDLVMRMVQKLKEQAVADARKYGSAEVKIGTVALRSVQGPLELAQKDLSRIRRWADYLPPFDPIAVAADGQGDAKPRESTLKANQDLLDALDREKRQAKSPGSHDRTHRDRIADRPDPRDGHLLPAGSPSKTREKDSRSKEPPSNVAVADRDRSQNAEITEKENDSRSKRSPEPRRARKSIEREEGEAAPGRDEPSPEKSLIANNHKNNKNGGSNNNNNNNTNNDKTNNIDGSHNNNNQASGKAEAPRKSSNANNAPPSLPPPSLPPPPLPQPAEDKGENVQAAPPTGPLTEQSEKVLPNGGATHPEASPTPTPKQEPKQEALPADRQHQEQPSLPETKDAPPKTPPPQQTALDAPPAEEAATAPPPGSKPRPEEHEADGAEKLASENPPSQQPLEAAQT